MRDVVHRISAIVSSRDETFGGPEGHVLLAAVLDIRYIQRVDTSHTCVRSKTELKGLDLGPSKELRDCGGARGAPRLRRLAGRYRPAHDRLRSTDKKSYQQNKLHRRLPIFESRTSCTQTRRVPTLPMLSLASSGTLIAPTLWPPLPHSLQTP